MIARRRGLARSPQRGADRDDAQHEREDHHEAEPVRERLVRIPLDDAARCTPDIAATTHHLRLASVIIGMAAQLTMRP
jgi:hypothetical protein